MPNLHRVVSKYLVWLLLAVYVLAAWLPGFGVVIRSIQLLALPWVGLEGLKITLPSGLLAILLFNAGLCMNTSDLLVLLRKPGILIFGVLANLAFPSTIVFVFHFGLRFWHNTIEVQTILESLAIVIAMPIAGASTAWAQNSNGNVALSLGLVIVSTLISPFTTPLLIDFVVAISRSGHVSSEFLALESSGIGAFLTYVIVIPSLLGLALHTIFGNKLAELIKPNVKMLNVLILLLLNYSNASTSLPEVVRSPDWDFLALILLVTGTLCASGFIIGWGSSGLFRVPKSQRVSLMYGLGMNNNGSALVIAANLFPNKPMMMLPIIAYNLLQHIMSGIANFIIIEVSGEVEDKEVSQPKPESIVHFSAEIIQAKNQQLQVKVPES